MLPRIPGVVSDYFWDMTRKLELILLDLPFASLQRAETSAARERILECIKSLMHDLAALTEYLGDVLAHVLPHTGKKNKAAQRAKDQMEFAVNRLFKIPINLVKHARFKLHWLERYTASELTAGFFVSGMIRQGTKGPASYKYPVEEGYSFALLLRTVLPTIFRLCEIAESALAEAKLFQNGASPSAVALDSEKASRLQFVTERLAALPIRCFPNEHHLRVPQLAFDGKRLFVQSTFRLLDFKAGSKFTFEMGSVAAGEKFKVPYWVPEGEF